MVGSTDGLVGALAGSGVGYVVCDWVDENEGTLEKDDGDKTVCEELASGD